MADDNALMSDLDADVMGVPVWLLGLIAVAGFFLIKHFVSGSSSTPVAIPVTTPPAGYPMSGYPSSSSPSSGGGSGSTGVTPFGGNQSPIEQWVTEFQNAVSALNLNNNNATDALENYLAGNTITSSAQRTTLQAVLSVVGPAPGIGAPKFGNPNSGEVTQYLFSTGGVGLAVKGPAPYPSGSGITGSTNPEFLGLTNPSELAQAEAEGLQIYYQPVYGEFVPVNSVKGTLLPFTTLYAKAPNTQP